MITCDSDPEFPFCYEQCWCDLHCVSSELFPLLFPEVTFFKCISIVMLILIGALLALYINSHLLWTSTVPTIFCFSSICLPIWLSCHRHWRIICLWGQLKMTKQADLALQNEINGVGGDTTRVSAREPWLFCFCKSLLMMDDESRQSEVWKRCLHWKPYAFHRASISLDKCYSNSLWRSEAICASFQETHRDRRFLARRIQRE